jgi:hypothetical protein
MKQYLLASVLAFSAPVIAHAQTSPVVTSDNTPSLTEADKFPVTPAPAIYGDQNKILLDENGQDAPSPNFMFNFPQYSLCANPNQTPEDEEKNKDDAANIWGALPLREREYCLALQPLPLVWVAPADQNTSTQIFFSTSPNSYEHLSSCTSSLILAHAERGN